MSGISSYSDWMSQLPVELHHIPMFNLAIPGKQAKPSRVWDEAPKNEVFYCQMV